MNKAEHPNPFIIAPEDLGDRLLVKALLPLISRVLGMNALAREYEKVVETVGDDDFVRTALEHFHVRTKVCSGALENIPAEGPVVITSNHPFGGLEALILLDLVRRVRPDVKFLANFILSRIPQLKDYFISVDPFDRSSSKRSNVSGLRDAFRWIGGGSTLCVFPSGTVSHLHLPQREIVDPPWSPSVATIIRRSKATVVPVYFHGRNSLLFQFLGVLHPMLRTAMLPRELLNKKHSTVAVHFGQSVSPERLRAFKDDKQLIEYLRIRTFILRNRAAKQDSPAASNRSFLGFSKRITPRQPVVPRPDVDILVKEIMELPEKQLLAQGGPFQAYYAYARQIPHLLREIGRLRELTFRMVNEGTGRSIDLDRFDNYYIHLFVWNKEKREIVGSYRMGKVDRILNRMGKQGLYTNTLFKFKDEVLKELTPAIELGRSFVTREYQKDYRSLLWLWKGIGHFLVQNPRYKYLFGPVSISSDYDNTSRQLIVSFLQQKNYQSEWSGHVRPRNRMKDQVVRGLDTKSLFFVVQDINEISELISEVQSRQQMVPVLLRQYLRLGGRLLGFNVDPDFSSALDGLILVDVTKTDQKVLERYLGKEGTKFFLDYHKNADDSPQSPLMPEA